ncbi:MAG TPA: bifunctional phosphoribosyl-AMP cyclohydrolase/phosphoribosyl-ATP diphosphatase HisIE [Firmicutes bacterium]|jgi:phosphoribosyl-ATP pyrophosphohydrolase/phosphoribosyl-AMP cyclohydrolase|nr:bifunctional phosphoribosyl-AMP cyclohydrolase/phosphoribosyl-ATP diphosphatase HisIE [Bacillota bacterium]
MEWLDRIKYDDRGLVPVIVQDTGSGRVLTLAYANREALVRTWREKRAWFYSRSRQKLWRKGETSGNGQQVNEICIDCDGDAVLYRVTPAGPACHTGFSSCFYRRVDPEGSLVQESDQPETLPPPGPEILAEVYQVIRQRQQDLPDNSYVTRLTRQGLDRILQKIGEEATEVVLAAKNQKQADTIYEMADLWFHCLLALGYLEMPPELVYAELQKRRK